MLVNKVYELFQELANKDEASGYISPEDINKYLEMCQFEIIGSYYNNPRAYQYNQREPRKGYENTIIIGDVFKELKELIVLTPDSNGQVTEPPDYMHFSSAMVNYNDVRDGEEVPMTTLVEMLRDNELPERLSSEIERPTPKFPVVVRYSNYWQFYPKDLEQVTLTYLKYPLTPFWNYTEVNGRPVFAETGGVATNPNSGVSSGDSTDLILPESMMYEVVYKLCEYMGISVREQLLYQAAQAQKNSEV